MEYQEHCNGIKIGRVNSIRVGKPLIVFNILSAISPEWLNHEAPFSFEFFSWPPRGGWSWVARYIPGLDHPEGVGDE